MCCNSSVFKRARSPSTAKGRKSVLQEDDGADKWKIVLGVPDGQEKLTDQAS